MKKLKTPFKSPMVRKPTVMDSARKLHTGYDTAMPSSSSPEHLTKETRSSPDLSEPISSPPLQQRLLTPRLAKSCKSTKIVLKTPHSDTGFLSKAAEISSLERRLQLLRQAEKFVQHPEDDDKLRSLIKQWRDAGRDMVERIFSLTPAPDLSEEGCQSSNATNNTYGLAASRSNFLDSFNDTIDKVDSSDCARDENGNMLDENGEPVSEPPSIEKIMDSLRSRSSENNRHEDTESGWSSRNHVDTESYSISPNTYDVKTAAQPTSSPEHTDWDYGALMRHLQIDPDLFDFDAEEGDWTEIEL